VSGASSSDGSDEESKSESEQRVKTRAKRVPAAKATKVAKAAKAPKAADTAKVEAAQRATMVLNHAALMKSTKRFNNKNQLVTACERAGIKNGVIKTFASASGVLDWEKAYRGLAEVEVAAMLGGTAS
jgi:hypothetical protein